LQLAQNELRRNDDAVEKSVSAMSAMRPSMMTLGVEDFVALLALLSPPKIPPSAARFQQVTFARAHDQAPHRPSAT